MAELTKNPENWKVLLVDDVPDNLMVAASILEFHGAVIKTATNGLEALEVLESFEANLILLDLAMPQMDGWELIKVLRADSKYQSLVIIAVTAHAYKTDQEHALASGFTGFITKPYDAVTFVDSIIDIMNKSYISQSQS